MARRRRGFGFVGCLPLFGAVVFGVSIGLIIGAYHATMMRACLEGNPGACMIIRR